MHSNDEFFVSTLQVSWDKNVWCEQSSDVFVIDGCSNQFHLKLTLLTFDVIRGKVFEYSFNKGVLS